MRHIMKVPFNMVAADGGVCRPVAAPHPRSGTNARVLGKLRPRGKVISLEEAVRRMTSLPAQKFQIERSRPAARGRGGPRHLR